MKKKLKVAVYHQNYTWPKAVHAYLQICCFFYYYCENKLEEYMYIFNTVITHSNPLNSV